MNKDLYFIPLLARAYDASDRVAGLKNAFGEIQQLGQLKKHRVGLEQFHRFMAESICKPVPNLLVAKENITIAELVPIQAVSEFRIAGLLPGFYSIRLETGRLLWAGHLREEDLLWALAFPSTALSLAADTHDTQDQWTRELKLLQEEIIVNVYPGLESGMLGIKIARWKIS